MPKLIFAKDPSTDQATQDELNAALKEIPAWPGSDKTLLDYAAYIVPIKRTSKNKETWRPYVTVDGRVTMWAHAHIGAEAPPVEEVVSTEVQTKFLVIHLRVSSAKFGTREDIATADMSATGFSVDATNPWENAVTSARGRVLGAFGFGLIPSQGLASAEEVEEGQRRRDRLEQAAAKPPTAAAKLAAAPAAESSGAPAEQPVETPPAAAPTVNEVPINNAVMEARKKSIEQTLKVMNLTWETAADVFQAFATQHNVSVDWTQWDAQTFQIFKQTVGK